MKLFGSLERLVKIVFRKSGFDVRIEPGTASANSIYTLPTADGDDELVGAGASQTLTNKTVVVANNTITTAASGNLAATELNAALAELQGDIDTRALASDLTNHLNDASDAHDASAISNVPAGNIAATDVQAAINELDSEKVAKSGDTMSGNLAMGGNKITGLGAPTTNGDALRYDQLGAANGIATLDGSGKVPVSQLPNAIMEYQGTWNASTNSPSLADGVGSPGDVYRVSVAGSQNLGSGSISFDVGDYAIYNGSTWEKADTTDAVSSVFGRTGAVTAQSGDYTASQVTNVPAGGIAATTVQAAINELDSEKFNSADFNSSFDTRLGTKSTSDLSEGTNLYFTDERAQDAVGAALTDSGSIDFTYNDAGNSITAAVIPGGVDHDALLNFVANEHVDHSSVSINTAANSGLSGGGDITASRSLVIDPNNATSVTAAAGDLILIADASDSNALKKVTAQSIADLASGSAAQSFTWTDGSATKSCSHTFGTKAVLVEVYDENDQTVWVDIVDRFSTSQVDLTRSEASVGGNWTVVIRN